MSQDPMLRYIQSSWVVCLLAEKKHNYHSAKRTALLGLELNWYLYFSQRHTLAVCNFVHNKHIMSVGNKSFIQAPAPWTCKCEAYWMMFNGSKTLPDNVFAPLEAQSTSFSHSQEAGKFRGGLGMIQIVRYSNTPVGQYVFWAMTMPAQSFTEAVTSGRELR